MADLIKVVVVVGLAVCAFFLALVGITIYQTEKKGRPSPRVEKTWDVLEGVTQRLTRKKK